MPTIYKVKVQAAQTQTFPFDVFYLVDAEHKALLPQMFPYAFCVPLTNDLRYMIRGLDDPPYPPPLYSDQGFLVVPVLPRTHRKNRSTGPTANPSYIFASQYRVYQRDQRTFAMFFTAYAVLFTPQGPIQPVCAACPNHLQHVIHNQCQLGDGQCYKQMLLKPYHNITVEPEREVS